MKIPSSLLLIGIPVLVLFCAVAILYSIGSNVETMQTTNTALVSSTNEKLNADDIVGVTVHSGLDIACPDLKGVAQHGYVYTVTLADARTLERLGCGVGAPEVYAAAIAQDLELHGGFEGLDANKVFSKLMFKFYDLNASAQ